MIEWIKRGVSYVVNRHEDRQLLTKKETDELFAKMIGESGMNLLHGKRFLKIKLKTLAAEARIIRLEERRARAELRNELHEHRVFEVRREARATHVAYAYLRGRSYQQTEGTCKDRKEMSWLWMRERVRAMVKKYGDRPIDFEKPLAEWFEARAEVGQGLSIPVASGSNPDARS